MAHMSLGLYHLDACAGSVLTPHDYITIVQKGLGNRVWVGGRQCRCCGSFLDPKLEAEATRGHHACVHAEVCDMKLADPGITTEPRGLTASQFRPADISTTAAVPGRSTLDVCVASSLQRQIAETPHKRHLVANSRITEMKLWNCYRPLIWTADGRPHVAVTRTLQNAADIASRRTGSRCRRITSAHVET